MQPASEMRLAEQLTIDWSKRLPRSFPEVLCIPMNHPDCAGYGRTSTAEIQSISDMGSYDPAEVLDEAQMKIISR